MRSNAAIVLLACALIVAPAAQAQTRSARVPALPETAQRVVALTDAFRQSEKLAIVEPDQQLLKAARYFADFMARTDKYGHAADGNEPAARAKKFGYDYCIVAENIAYLFSSVGFTTGELADRFFRGWQDSPGHRKNMLDPNVTDTGVAIARSSKTGHYYAVQLFGRPKAATIQFSVANRVGVPVEYSVDDRAFQLPPRATRTHQMCRPSVVTLRATTIEPRNGQNLVVTSEGGTLQLKTN